MVRMVEEQEEEKCGEKHGEIVAAAKIWLKRNAQCRGIMTESYGERPREMACNMAAIRWLIAHRPGEAAGAVKNQAAPSINITAGCQSAIARLLIINMYMYLAKASSLAFSPRPYLHL